jgi:hypothetical protein
MREMADLVGGYEQGIYTFAEAVTAIVCEAAVRNPGDLAIELPARFLDGVKDWACALPDAATSDDVVVLKSGRAHAELLFRGAVTWRRYFRTEHAGRIG